MAKQETGDKLFDINRFPNSEGIILFGISMNRVGNIQSPKACFEYIKHLASKIEYTEGIALVVLYGDYLYLHSDAPAHTLRDRFLALMVSHKNALMKILRKDRKWTHKAFSFSTFGQLLLDNSDVYQDAFKKIKKLYETDEVFKQHVNVDCSNTGHKVGAREVTFILEEITMFYLAQKGVLKLGNSFVSDAERNWVLQVYPGQPLQSEIYLFQKNPLKLSNPKNRYANSFYDLEAKKLHHYTDMKEL